MIGMFYSTLGTYETVMMYVFLLMWNLSPYNLGVNVINFFVGFIH